MPDLIIDTMSEKDIDTVLLIESASFPHPWSRISFLNELSNKYSHNFILKLENSSGTYQIVAYLCYRIIDDEAYILKIAVHPEQRRKGFAFKLINHCLAEISDGDATSAILDVRQSNTAGIGLYKKIGFFTEGQIPNYYLDTREDGILMRKNL